MIDTIEQNAKTTRYILNRRCRDGGYCFYRLNEPNVADTFYALASLQMLDALPEDDNATISFLHSFQKEDGSFSNVFVGCRAIAGLIILGDQPQRDPTDWIISSLGPPQDGIRPIESSSRYCQMYLLTDLCRSLAIRATGPVRETIINTILWNVHLEGEAGFQSATLTDTSYALSILVNLGYPLSSIRSSSCIRCFEDPEFGFLVVPGIYPPYLEDIHAGVLVSFLLGYHPAFLRSCEAFIMRCVHQSGGYVRSIFGGSATLEHTYLALDAMRMIGGIRKNNIGCTSYPGTA